MILLAPMEGVVDPVVRDLWTQIGGIDYCVTEFIRITSQLLPPKVFYRYCPELHHESKTKAGTPVFVQLLGSDLTTMGENAHRAIELGAFAIDLNFGCPAKTVNRHDGGAALLKDPDRVFKVVESVRKAVPKDKWVTVKVRLGFSDKTLTKEIAHAAEDGGGHWLTVHGRTKEEAYRPPAHWEYIRDMQEVVKIPVIANGDIWSKEDNERCQLTSGCEDTMLGRGLIATPDLAWQIKTGNKAREFHEYSSFIISFIENSKASRNEVFAVQRTKQLTKLMARTFSESQELFEDIKREKDYSVILEKVKIHFRSRVIRPSELSTSNPQCSANQARL